MKEQQRSSVLGVVEILLLMIILSALLLVVTISQGAPAVTTATFRVNRELQYNGPGPFVIKVRSGVPNGQLCVWPDWRLWREAGGEQSPKQNCPGVLRSDGTVLLEVGYDGPIDWWVKDARHLSESGRARTGETVTVTLRSRGDIGSVVQTEKGAMVELGDDLVDADDFRLLTREFGKVIDPTDYRQKLVDLNGSGTVDIEDFRVMKRNWGLSRMPWPSAE
jgi:hypothetical protein